MGGGQPARVPRRPGRARHLRRRRPGRSGSAAGQHADGLTRPARLAAFAGFLLGWGNLQHALIGASARLPGGSWAFVVAGAALVGASLLAARWLGLDRGAIGIRRRGALGGAAIGALAGALAAVFGLAALRVAALALDLTIEYAPLAGISSAALAAHIAFFLPLAAVVPEELAFRGTLYGALDRVGPRAAILGSAAAFAAWHLAVAAVTIADTTLSPPSPLFGVALAGALAVVLAGGLAFGVLRARTRTLASTVAAHWAFNAVVLIGLRGSA